MRDKQKGEEYTGKDWAIGLIVVALALIGLFNVMLFIMRLITGE